MDAQEYFGKSNITLFHGSRDRIEHPRFGVGNPHNDYGLAFYTTELRELASEWACPSRFDGWVNEYVLDTPGLKVLDLGGEGLGVLHWLAVLVEHRMVNASTPLAVRGIDFLRKNYAVDLRGADIVYGYRADDSYYAMARAFLNNGITVEALEEGLFLGGLGYQAALMSERAFSRLSFVGAERANAAVWNPRRLKRDRAARDSFRETVCRFHADGTYLSDIMRGV